MAATIDTIDKRLTELETLVWKLPTLQNTRLPKYDAATREQSERMDRLERSLFMLQTDMRDLRNGVTGFMTEFDKRMKALEDRLEVYKTETNARLSGIEVRLDKVETRLSSVETRMGSVETKIDELRVSIAEVLRRLPKV